MGMSQLSFLAIDFETANPDQASVCQVGIAKVVNGEIVESTSWLVKPPTGVHSFEPRFIRLHGITPKQVRRSGISWQESLQRIEHLAGGLPLVAHNISFDRTVYRRASERAGVAAPPTTWFDTLVISRRFITAPNHRLPTVAAALNLPKFTHHQAEADAVTCARIAIVLSEQQQLHSVSELWDRPTRRRHSAFPARRFTRVSDLPEPNVDAHPEHPLHGHHVVITGDLNGLSRDDFIVQVAKLGAQPQLNVTKKTTMLIVAGHQVFPAHYDPMLGTSKEKKAHEYRLAGQQIEFVAGQRARELLTLQVQERIEPAVVPLKQPRQTPVAQPDQVEGPKVSHEPQPLVEPPAPSEPQNSAPRPITLPLADRLTSQNPRSRRRSRVIRPFSWLLVGISGLLVFLFLFGVVGAALTNPEISWGSWILAVIIMTPILAAPGLVGWYLLRRHPSETLLNA